MRPAFLTIVAASLGLVVASSDGARAQSMSRPTITKPTIGTVTNQVPGFPPTVTKPTIGTVTQYNPGYPPTVTKPYITRPTIGTVVPPTPVYDPPIVMPIYPPPMVIVAPSPWYPPVNPWVNPWSNPWSNPWASPWQQPISPIYPAFAPIAPPPVFGSGFPTF